MTKICLYLSLTGVALACGCNNTQFDNSKIERLSQKLDLVLSNQAAITARLDTLAAVKQIDSMGYYYHTNSLNILYNESDKIQRQNAQLASLAGHFDELLLTNLFRLETGQSALQESVMDGNKSSGGALFLLTNSTILDVGYTRLKIDDVGRDMRFIKAKLGVFN